MKKLILIAMILPMIWLSSCSKDEDTTPQTYEDGFFTVRWVGNYSYDEYMAGGGSINIIGYESDASILDFDDARFWVCQTYHLNYIEVRDTWDHFDHCQHVDKIRIKIHANDYVTVIYTKDGVETSDSQRYVKYIR